ncbi:hypothetical protein MMC13_006176 [Lambiella insularis]|nr:hypothetical protein [Lambiella insularis]
MTTTFNPFVHRHGRRFLRDQTLPYPLPVDLIEVHRETLRTLMLMSVYGAPFCSQTFEKSAPRKVLEVACGSALWSSSCHHYFKLRGHSNVSFTGVDIAPLAPDLKEQGLDWRFVQHDFRSGPLPFSEAEFDFVFVKDIGLTAPETPLTRNIWTDTLRVLKAGGVMEWWETDHLFRTLLPHQAIPPAITKEEIDQAEGTATYIISSSTAFAKAQNTYFSQYNTWLQKAFHKRHLTPLPCSLTDWAFSSDPDVIGGIGTRRIAIPFGEVRWEREGVGGEGITPKGHLHGKDAAIAEKQSNIEPRILTTHQSAIRRIALTTTIQFIEGLESILKVESGKRQDEWDRWWAGMMNNLLVQNGTLNGECLEVGAWWGVKQ